MTLETDIPTQRRFDWRSTVETFGPVLALVVLVIVTAAIEHATRDVPVFLSWENGLNILKHNAFVGIVAIGMTLVIISGGIDLSVGSLVAMAGGLGMWLMNIAVNASKYIAENESALRRHAEDLAMGIEMPLDLPHSATQIWLAKLFQSMNVAGSEGWGTGIAVVTALAIATLSGWIAGFIIAKGRVAPFIVTLGLLAFYRSVILTVANNSEIRSASQDVFPVIGTQGFAIGQQTVTWPVVVFLVVAVAAAYLLNKTRFGRYVFAIGSNERAAVYSAIHVDRIKIWTYALMGTCCGIAAVLSSSRYTAVSPAASGLFYELDAIAAVVIGGTRLSGGAGRITGTLVGVLMLGVINNMLGILNVNDSVQGMVKGSIIIAAALLQQVGRKQ
jgi:ribose transport system permease protein